MTNAEHQIERRITLEIVAERVPVVAELIAEHVAAVEACRLAAGAFAAARINVEADPMDAGAQTMRDELQRGIDAVRSIAERYA